MTTCWRRQKATRIFTIFAASAVLILSACQEAPTPTFEQPSASWRVLESQGNARIENNEVFFSRELRPGDQLTGNSHIVMDRSAYLIAAGNGLQLTASGDTSVIIPHNSSSTLRPIHGTMRLRLASAADNVQRITTPHLTVSGTTAILELSVDDQETTIEVSSGHVALSTSGGEHYARLVAGASARLGEGSQGELEIRPAKGLPFNVSEKLGSVAKDDDAPPLVHRPKQIDQMTVILPASQQRAKMLEQSSRSRADQTEQLDAPSVLPAGATILTYPGSETLGGSVNTVEPSGNQQRFDRLTNGLLNNLPTVDKRI